MRETYVALRHRGVRHSIGQLLELGRRRKQRSALGARDRARVSSRRLKVHGDRVELGQRRRGLLVVLRHGEDGVAERGDNGQERQEVGASNHFDWRLVSLDEQAKVLGQRTRMTCLESEVWANECRNSCLKGRQAEDRW